MDVFLFGSKKRVIQIETRFESTPHIVTSYACPNTSALGSCSSFWSSASRNEALDGFEVLTRNVSRSSAQGANVYQKYVYHIEGDLCMTNVKVRM